jgi:hypothetical protein
MVIFLAPRNADTASYHRKRNQGLAARADNAISSAESEGNIGNIGRNGTQHVKAANPFVGQVELNDFNKLPGWGKGARNRCVLLDE